MEALEENSFKDNKNTKKKSFILIIYFAPFDYKYTFYIFVISLTFYYIIIYFQCIMIISKYNYVQILFWFSVLEKIENFQMKLTGSNDDAKKKNI